MKELLNSLIDLIGKISVPVFVAMIAVIISGYFPRVRESTFWRTLVAYLGNVDVYPSEETRKKKTIEV